jgi:HK97 family phage portal protein
MTRLTKAEKRAKAAAMETRAGAGDISFDLLSAGFDAGNVGRVNAKSAEALSAVTACVNIVSTSIAALPVSVYRRTDAGRVEQPEHPLARIIQRGANPWQSWPDFVEWMVAQILLRGNGLAEVRTDGAGRVSSLTPIPWEWASVQVLSSGRLVYDVSEIQSIFSGTGRTRRLLAGETLHVRDRSDDGIVGRSRIRRAATAMGAAIDTQKFDRAMWRNGVSPSGVVTLKKPLTVEGLAALQREFQQKMSGANNARKVVFLDNDAEYKPVSVSPHDAELLAARRFSVEEVCRIFQVPPVMVGDLSNSSFTNAETLGRYFAQFTLRAWCRKLEAEIARAVFTDDELGVMHLEFDLSDFTRGDPAVRWKNHEIAVRNDILSRNEIREIEGFNPREGGDDAITAPGSGPGSQEDEDRPQP